MGSEIVDSKFVEMDSDIDTIGYETVDPLVLWILFCICRHCLLHVLFASRFRFLPKISKMNDTYRNLKTRRRSLGSHIVASTYLIDYPFTLLLLNPPLSKPPFILPLITYSLSSIYTPLAQFSQSCVCYSSRLFTYNLNILRLIRPTKPTPIHTSKYSDLIRRAHTLRVRLTALKLSILSIVNGYLLSATQWSHIQKTTRYGVSKLHQLQIITIRIATEQLKMAIETIRQLCSKLWRTEFKLYIKDRVQFMKGLFPSSLISRSQTG